MFFSPPYFSPSCFLTDKILFLILQVTAVHPVGEGQCIALGYESALPLVLLTLQGGDIKPYEFPTEGTKAMAGTDVKIEFEGIKCAPVEDDNEVRNDSYGKV